MAETTFNYPRVDTKEIDRTGPTTLTPQGIPAGVIGTSLKGPAFVPVNSPTFQDWKSVFGDTDGKKFGPLAMNEWMKNSSSGVYVRVLGAGNGEKRNSTTGIVTNAGFVVGGQTPQANGNIGANIYAGTGGLVLGRTYFLGAFMSQSAGSTIFSDAGIQTLGNDGAEPILRGVVMAPSGVVLALSGVYGGLGEMTASSVSQGVFLSGEDGGSMVGSVDLGSGKEDFIMLLNGHTDTSNYPNAISASFDPQAPHYFANVFNADPQKTEQAGHLLYTHYDIYQSVATVTGSGGIGSIEPTGSFESIAFLLTSSLGRNAGSTTVSNYENFEDRYRTAYSPWITSQKFGGLPVNLFKVHALDDGESSNTLIKCSIENLAKSLADDSYGTFDLVVRDFSDNDLNPVKLERWSGLTLDPTSERYISRVIGDMYVYFDFDKRIGSQKLVVEGVHPNNSRYIRVEMASDVDNGFTDKTSLPVGFRGPDHLVTSGSGVMAAASMGDAGFSLPAATVTKMKDEVMQAPVPYRDNLAVGVDPKKIVEPSLYWGVHFAIQDSVSEPNKNTKPNTAIGSFTKYFPRFDNTNLKFSVGGNEGTADANGTVLDADRFNNNIFTLEHVQVKTGSSNTPDAKEWAAAAYRRDGALDANITTSRFLSVQDDFGIPSARKFLKFSFFVQGGFDGVNLFDKEKAELSDTAIRREMDDSTNQGGVKGPTVASFRKAIDIMGETADVDIQIFAIPGIRHNSITDYALDTTEKRFDALYIMDLEERDQINSVMTSSLTQKVSVTNTVDAHKSRNIDSSFGTAYFPDVVIEDPGTKTNLVCPPTVAVLGAFALNDAVGHPWFAPAGFTRGALPSTRELAVKLNQNNLNALVGANINALVAFPGTTGPVVWGQKTLQVAQSALDRVNVRRLLIDIRRKVKAVGNTIMFEPNREDTLKKFEDAVRPILQRIQQQRGLERFKVQIDASTTSQSDISENRIKGKIYLQPTKSVEFISLDFVVSNAGTEI